MRERQATYPGVAHALRGLTREELLALQDHPRKVKKFLAQLAREAEVNTFFHFLSDDRAADLLTTLATKSCRRERANQIVKAWRKIADDHKHTGPVAAEVRSGFTLDQALQANLCLKADDGDDLPGIDRLENDGPTCSALAFFVPRLLENSTYKGTSEQLKLLRELREELELPTHHLTTFGNLTFLAGLILAHQIRIEEKVPLEHRRIVTDTLSRYGERLLLMRHAFLDGQLLQGGVWPQKNDETGNWDLGCFPLAIEPIR